MIFLILSTIFYLTAIILGVIVMIGLILPESKFSIKTYELITYSSKESKKERERLKEIEEREKVYKNGTPDDIINFNNSKNQNYQMMTNNELYKKYSNIPKNKIEIIDTPSAMYNSDEKKILHTFEERWEIKNNRLQIKSGNKIINVDSHLECPNVKNIKNGEKVLIFRHKTERFRFKILQLI